MIVLFGVHDPNYPRTRMLQAQLRGWTDERVQLVPLNHARGRLLKPLVLLVRGLTQRGRLSVVVLTEFSLQYAILAWVVARVRGARLVVDRFVGTYETHVLDYQSAAPKSGRARYFRAVDALAYRLADVVTIDTEMRAIRLQNSMRRFGTRPVYSLPVGAPEWAKDVRNVPGLERASVLRVLFYGNYLPLHGVEYVIDAMASVPRTVPFLLTVVGSSPDRPRIETKAKKLGLSDNCVFVDSLAENELAALMAENHVVLGIFGDTAKARSVVANKVWQGLYAGRTVISRDSPALTELLPLVGKQLRPVRFDDPAGLGKIIVELATSPASALHPSRSASLDAYVRNAHEELFRELGIIKRS